MRYFQGFLFLFFGLGLLLMIFQSLSKGWLPMGSNGFKGKIELRKDSNPLGFWLVFGLYALAGIALTIYSLMVLTGKAAPLQTR